jgi:hypothetical protein
LYIKFIIDKEMRIGLIFLETILWAMFGALMMIKVGVFVAGVWKLVTVQGTLWGSWEGNFEIFPWLLSRY